MIDSKFRSFKLLKKSPEFNKMLRVFTNISKKSMNLKIKPPYKFISSDDVYFLSSLFNNKILIDIFIKTFWYKKNQKNLCNVLQSVLNDIIYLYVIASKYKKIKKYSDITQKDIDIFSNILEINKIFHKKIQILLPAKTNSVIVFVNSLINI